MMRRHSKYLAGAVLLGLVLPSLSFAIERPIGARASGTPRMMMGANASGTPKAGENFCTRLDSIVAKMEEKASEREGKLGEKRGEREGKLREKQASTSAARSDHRDAWDEHRGELFEKLDAKASTSDAQAAVATFKSEVDAAVATRRAAVDKAVSDFRAALDKAIAERQAAVDAATKAFKDARSAAVATAKADCASGKDPVEVRTALMGSLKSAQDALKTSIQGIEKRKDALKPLADQRKADVEKAVKDFQAALDAAKAKLKAGWNLKENVK